MAKDVAKMKTYFDKLIATFKSSLLENEKNEKAFRNLIEGTYCSLLLSNKRRVGELQRIYLDAYLKHQDQKPYGEFENLLSETEKILIKKLKRIVIKGKRGRGVPVLFDKVTQEGIDVSIKCRRNFLENNPYLFGICYSDNCISGYHVFRKHVISALGDPAKVSCLTSTKLRKHLATTSQILKIDNDCLEQFATFIGHTTKTHTEWYRLPSDIYQTAKVSKILLLAQKNKINQYKGQSLDEINIESEIMESGSESGEGEEIVDDENENDDPQHFDTENDITTANTRHPWSQEEKRITETFFRRHIEKKYPPDEQKFWNL